MLYPILLILVFTILAFGAVSGRIERSPITAPMIFTALGFLIGNAELGLIHIDISSTLAMTLAELALVIVLFTDASRIDISILRSAESLPIRMLAIGLPLTIVVGSAGSFLVFPELEFWGAAILATILAPTDAALGQAVVSLKSVPIRIRQAINVESGLNDGIAVPILLIVLWCAGAEVEGAGAGYWVTFVAGQLLLGPAVGIGFGWLGGLLVSVSERRGWMNPEFQRLSLIALAVGAYGIAHVVGGNGFIAAFTAGLTVGSAHRSIVDRLHGFAEAEGQLLTMLVFMLFGAVMIPQGIPQIAAMPWQTLLYAILSLTVVRMLPVALSLTGSGLRASTVLFLGWFGPRGIASVIFALLVLERSGVPHKQLIFGIAVTVIMASIALHGLTAWPLSTWYGRIIRDQEDFETEHRDVKPMPTRFGRTGDERRNISETPSQSGSDL